MTQNLLKAREILQEKIGKENFETWIEPLTLQEAEPGTIKIEVPSKLFREWLTEHYLPIIEESCSEVYLTPVKIFLTINPALLRVSDNHRPPVFKTRHVRPLSLIPKYTFENFIVGASNQFAHAASLAVANQPGDHYNPLFIYGGVGLGKTHLVNAIGHKLLESRRETKVQYLSSESFMNELIASLRRDKMVDFKNHFRSIDALIVDDVQFIAGKERTQEEFFHTFNSLYESHKQIIITSDKFPKEIPDMEDRLRNRFEWGLIADIQPPDMETRVAILAQKADVEGVSLPNDVAIFLASHISSNVRELEGSLTRLGAFASLTKTEITISLAKDVLRNSLNLTHREVTIENIQKAVCDHFNLKLGELKSKRRTKSIALPRQVGMYLCRKYTSTSFPTIGDKFGGRDHSTVIHASKTIEKKIKEDPDMQATIDKLVRFLKT